MKNRIINFLAQGMKPSQVAAIVGVTPAYVSQLAKNEDVAKLIAEKAAEIAPTLTDDVILTNKYMAVEHNILKHIEDNIGMAEFRDAIRALEVVGNRQEKRLARMHTPQAPNGGFVINNVLNLTLPSHISLNAPSYQLNEKKEIVAIGNKPMAPLSSDGVKSLFAQASGRTSAQEKEESATIIDI